MNFDDTVPFYIRKSYTSLKHMTNFSPYKATDSTWEHK